MVLDTGRLDGIWDHHPDGPTAEIGSGTPVRAVQAALALRGQRLAVDPPSEGATIGGMLAVNESGPLRHRFGTPAAQVERITYVDREGVAERVRRRGRQAGHRRGGRRDPVGAGAAAAPRRRPAAGCWCRSRRRYRCTTWSRRPCRSGPSRAR
nr:hypothetical protein GCM10020092_106180 [Actinoplanes digitatis]